MAKPGERFKTYGNVFDHFTLRTLFKLQGQGHFDDLESPIMIGKEANVFSAKKGEGRVCVKIYRLEACDFTRMFEYIRHDPRYLDLQGKRRKIIFAWVQREFRNLTKAREGGVRVPQPIAFVGNVLVMELIGAPAPQLKDTRPKAPKRLLEEITRQMGLLYQTGLVHGDLSPFNILVEKELPVLIDFSQATPLKAAEGMLERDVRNVANWFKKSVLVDDQAMLRAITHK